MCFVEACALKCDLEIEIDFNTKIVLKHRVSTLEKSSRSNGHKIQIVSVKSKSLMRHKSHPVIDKGHIFQFKPYSQSKPYSLTPPISRKIYKPAAWFYVEMSLRLIAYRKT